MQNLSTGKDYYSDSLPSSSKWVKENFVLGDLLGSGTFGTVYTVQCRKKPDTLYAIKEISRASSPKYIASELKIMRDLGGSHNVMNVHASFRDKDRIFIVMDHFPHDPLKNLLGVMTNAEKIEYMKNLFISLDYMHRNNYIHRDVKPANFLYNRKARKYALIDFGLSQTYDPKLFSKHRTVLSPRKRVAKPLGNNVNEVSPKRKLVNCECFGKTQLCQNCMTRPIKLVNKAGTPGFRAPEILLKFDNEYQTPALDIWSAGITLMGLLFRRHPVFRPCDDFEAIAQLCQVFGSAPLQEVASVRGINLLLQPEYPGIDLVKLMRSVRPGLDILDGPADRCKTCRKLFHKNVKGKCLCKSGEPCSIEGLADDERILLNILNHCLQVDPIHRFTASMLLDMIEVEGY